MGSNEASQNSKQGRIIKKKTFCIYMEANRIKEKPIGSELLIDPSAKLKIHLYQLTDKSLLGKWKHTQLITLTLQLNVKLERI